MQAYRFSEFIELEGTQSTFEKLLELFLEILTQTGGDMAETLHWMNMLDEKYKLTNEDYGMGDFIQDLKDKGYIEDDDKPGGTFKVKPKAGQTIRKRSLEAIFGRIKKSARGDHRSTFSGLGDEATTDRRAFQFGDGIEQIDMTDSLRNAQIKHGIDQFRLTEDDLEVVENEAKSQTATVLMIDISHSMILYGEDRITPAKKVAMALAELITTRYPKDTLDIIVFGNDAWQIEIKDLPFLDVGPYHTNTVAGLELAMDILRRRKNPNKQIFMITDGKPSCLKEGLNYYKNAYGLDRKIINRTLRLARQCRKLDILITTFMVAQDRFLQQFIREFTQTNNGKAFYTGLNGLGDFVFEDYVKNRRRRVR